MPSRHLQGSSARRVRRIIADRLAWPYVPPASATPGAGMPRFALLKCQGVGNSSKVGDRVVAQSQGSLCGAAIVAPFGPLSPRSGVQGEMRWTLRSDTQRSGTWHTFNVTA
jgi:hypothetical protein